MRRKVVLLLAACALLAGCSFRSPDGSAPSQVREFTFVAPGGETRLTYDPPQTRGRVTGLSGEDLMNPDRRIGVDDFSGQIVVLNIWGSWCGPCREEIPDLQQTYAQTRERGAVVLGIDVRDDRQAAQDFLRARAVAYPSIFDPAGRSLVALGGFPPNVVPSTIVLDRRHRVAAVFLGAVRISELRPVVDRLLAEPATESPPGPPDRP
ncbi:TlpA disulfide reductase family protein [Pseudonocardia halophobica]|uniref:Thioredoxin n=1 Tax=Pseudonocardia halophobica TaxID=29401 RepID=A0A9W6KZ53_9PSEU|nr:TlpA disulfide reductase family protein [Pseudonocardia halophobica]GLL09304.1 thioredoxin [Pseudonocardia halophobica]